MQVPAKPDDEDQRIETLRAVGILDTDAEERFDRLTRLAKRLFGVSIALVSLVDEDRQWFKSCQGLEVSETGRDISFCGHAILGDDVFLIPDASRDERFSDNPLVTGPPNIRFYAGCPLRVANGSKLGTLCIIDDRARDMDEEDLALLRDLARMAEQELTAIQLATMDELTLLSNRRGFEALSQHALALCRRLTRPASLVYFDLDRFKEINDKLGHAAGDRALREFAELLRVTFRESDVLGRLGGDEFAVLLTTTSSEDIRRARERLQEAVERHNAESRTGYRLAFSAGAVEFDPESHVGITDLLAEADEQMYADKAARRAAHKADEQTDREQGAA